MVFKDLLKAWRGGMSLKEAAAVLDIDYPSYRKYETGKRTPCKLARAEIARRMEENPQERMSRLATLSSAETRSLMGMKAEQPEE